MVVEIKNIVLDSARKIIGHNGISSLSISKVAQEADISKSHVYYYFDSKRDLIDQLIDEEIDKYSSIKSTITDSDNITTRINTLFDYVQNQVNEEVADFARGSILITLAMETVNSDPKINEKLRNFSNSVLDDVYLLVKESEIFETEEEEHLFSREFFSMVLGALVMSRVTKTQNTINYLKLNLIEKLTKSVD